MSDFGSFDLGSFVSHRMFVLHREIVIHPKEEWKPVQEVVPLADEVNQNNDGKTVRHNPGFIVNRV